MSVCAAQALPEMGVDIRVDTDLTQLDLTQSGVSGFLCLGRLFQGQPNEAALCI